MPIGIVCPSCAARYRVPDQYAGKSATCKKCNTRISVPTLEAELRLRDDDGGPGDSVEMMRSASMAAMQTPAPPRRTEAASEAAPAAPRRNPPGRAAPSTPSALPQPPAFGEDGDDAESGPERDPSAVRQVHVGPDPWSGLLVLLYLATLTSIGLFNQYSAGRVAADLRSATPVGGLWTGIVLQGVLFFVIVVPLAMVGMFAASQILRFALAPSAYLKSAGAAAAPLVGVGLAYLIVGQFLTGKSAADGASPLVGVVNMVGIIGGLAGALFLIRYAFGLKWAEAGAAFALAALLGGIGIGLQGAIGDSLARTVTVAMRLKTTAAVATAKPSDNLSQASHPTDIVPPPAPVAEDALTTKLAALTQQANALSSAQAMHSNSRESLASSFATLQTQAGAIADEVRTRQDLTDRYAALMATLKGAPTLLSSVPSAKPDATLDQPLATTGLIPLTVPDSAADTLGDEVSIGTFKVRPPKAGVLDFSAMAAVKSAANSASLSWTTPEGGRFTVGLSPVVAPRQKQPWVRTQPFMQQSAKLFTIDDTTAGSVITGAAMLNQMPVTRVASTDSAAPDRFEQLIALGNEGWAVATAQSVGPDGFSAVDAAARTLRYAPTEPKVDLLTPALVADHLGDDTDGAAAMLRRMGPPAEPAVIDKLHDHNVTVRRRAIEVLGDIGSQKSIVALAAVVRSNDTFCAEAAKASLRKLAPKSMDATNEALLDLEGSNPQQQRSAMLKLAELKPDDARRPRIAAALERIVIEGPLGENSEVDAAGDALAVWATPETIRSLLPLLDSSTDIGRRHAALDVFAKMRTQKAAYQLARYMATNPADAEAAKNSLGTMGPVAEPDVIRDLMDPNATVRRDACEVLAQIGTQKSVNALGPVIRDPHDLTVAAAAKSAMLSIKDRIAAAAGAPTGLFDLGK